MPFMTQEHFMQFVVWVTFFSSRKQAAQLGWLGLYSDMSKVGNLNLFGRQIDGDNEISG